jgi:hypothetical protein
VITDILPALVVGYYVDDVGAKRFVLSGCAEREKCPKRERDESELPR